MADDHVTKMLLPAAAQALVHAHAPYTARRVGVAVRTKEGRIYSACNIENPAFQGVESLEALIGALLIGSRWAEGGALPVMEEILYCFDNVWPGADSYMPEAAGLTILRLFGSPSATLYFATAEKGVFDTKAVSGLVPHMPAQAFDRDKFSAASQERYKKSLAVAARDAQQENLFHARLQAFDWVSNYAVGVMVEEQGGELFYGCNIELGGNRALHAESMAIAAMVAAKGPAARIRRITVLTGGDIAYPCGGCRQHISEFATPDTVVICVNTRGEQVEARQADLLPHSYGRATLASGARG